MSPADVRDRLAALIERADLNQAKLAKKMGILPGTLGYYVRDRPGDFLPMKIAVKLADALAEHGIERADVLDLARPSEPGGMSDVDAERWQPDFASEALRMAIEALREGQPNRHPWRIRGRALRAAGIRAGDIVLVDHDRLDPRIGAVVCAQIADPATGEARTAFRLHQPPVLIAADAEAGAPIPLTHATIMGTCIAVIRQMD